MAEVLSVQKRNVDNFEELREALRGTQREIVQLERGQLRGHIVHLSIGDLPLNFGTFTVGLRSTGICSRDRITIGMLTGRKNKVTRWSREIYPGDIVITPPGDENERRYHSGASYSAISITPDEIPSLFGSEPRLLDPIFWQRKYYPAGPQISERIVPRLHSLIERLQNTNVKLTESTAEFWKRSIIEIMLTPVLMNAASDRDGPMPSASRIVRKVDDYLDWTGTAPIHISQICTKLNVSRRTLHRAFHETLGIGPVTYLQRRRLCSIHSALRRGNPAKTTISDVALQHGFVNLGRFSGYYHSLFGEYPSETLKCVTGPHGVVRLEC